MSPKCALAAAALLVCTSSFAVTPNGGTVSAPDPASELLTGLHDSNGAAFTDTFDFTVTGARDAGSVFFTLSFVDVALNQGVAPFTFNGIALADSFNVQLALDIDGSDGWSVTAALPGAGTYRLFVDGKAPSFLGPTGAAVPVFYLGAMGTQVNAVPEPSTYALMALGLLALAGVRRRR